MNEIQQLINENLPSELVRFDERMSQHTSFQIGGPADVFLLPRSIEQLLLSMALIKKHDLPFFFLGGGTNLLVSDRGMRAVVICLNKLSEVTVSGTTLRAQTGASIEKISRIAAEHSLSGIEFIHGLPGTIGGAVWMNARCYGGSISDVLRVVDVVDGELSIEKRTCRSSEFSYKHSPFQKMDGCILEVELQLCNGDHDLICEKMAENLRDRDEKKHFAAPSAGSLFKNDRSFGSPTGKIIDDLGLRGKVSGGAAIAPYHGNIFINENEATAMDVLDLIRQAVTLAEEKLKIRLEPEVRLVGEWLPEELAFLC